MKKLFASLFVAFAMIAMVSCSSKPANDAAKESSSKPANDAAKESSSKPAIEAAEVSSSNPAIDAAEDFIDNPTIENAEKVDKAVEELNADEKKEFEEWCKENEADLEAAAFKAFN